MVFRTKAVAFVINRVSHEDVFWAGLSHDGMEPWEDEYFAAHDLTWAAPEELEKTSEPLVHWVRERDFGHVAVHFDVDVLSPDDFKSTYLSAPGRDYSGVTAGKMTLAQVTRLLCDLAEVTDIVGLTIAEVMPWDYVALKQQLARLEILAG